MAADRPPFDAWDGGAVRATTAWPVQLFRRLHIQAYLDFMSMTRDVRFFCVNMISDVVRSLSGVMAVFLLAERFDGIGTWDREQIVFMLGYGALVGGMLDMFFGYNVLAISRRLGRGQLDHSLVQPQPLWMTMLTEGFMPFIGLFPVAAGAAIVGWSLQHIDVTLDPLWWVLFAVQLLASCTVVLAFSFLWGSLAFWSPVGAEEISSRVMRMSHQLKMFPLDGLSPWLVQVLLIAVPVGFVAWHPSRVLLGMPGATPWHGPVFAASLALVTAFVFRRGLEQYERTGSQRYLPFGHRN